MQCRTPLGVYSLLRTYEERPYRCAQQVALIHKPSQSLLTADTFLHMAAKQGEAPKASLPPSGEPFVYRTHFSTD